MPSREIVEQFIELVEQGQFVDALQRFYAEDATIQENLIEPPRSGLPVLMQHERGVIAHFDKITARRVGPYFIDGDHVLINWVFEFTDRTGRTVRLDEMARQLWRGEKLLQERFYYDPVQLQR